MSHIWDKVLRWAFCCSIRFIWVLPGACYVSLHIILSWKAEVLANRAILQHLLIIERVLRLRAEVVSALPNEANVLAYVFLSEEVGEKHDNVEQEHGYNYPSLDLDAHLHFPLFN